MLFRQSSSASYNRLAGFYFFYFASLGAFLPYWNLYLKHLGFEASQIGELTATFLATKIIAPNLWAWIVDHTGKRMWIIRITAFVGMLIFSTLLVVTDYWLMLIVLAGFSFFWYGVLPQFEASTMDYLGVRKHLYSRIRLWGSVGFIIASSVLAIVLQHYGIHHLPWIISIILLFVWLNTLTVHEAENLKVVHTKTSLLKTCFTSHVLALLLACFLIQASHGAYYAFFSIYLQDHQYSRAMIGQLWSLGVVAEVVVFYWMHLWLPKFGAKNLLVVAMLLTILRWALIALFVESLPILLFAQLLHAASFGLFHASAIHLIDEYFSGNIQGRGQALYSSISFGLGGSLGSLVSGYTWNSIGSSYVYLLAMAVAILALIQYVWISRDRTEISTS